jgi:hypothetical protein
MSSEKATSTETTYSQGSIETVRETDRFGRNTGHSFYRCLTCGAEVMTSWGRSGLAHAAGCPNGGASR